VELDRKIIQSALVTMALHRVSEADMRRAVPNVPEAMMTFADFLYSSGKPKEARSEYMETLAVIEKQDRINPSHFYRIYRFFKKDGDSKNALKVLVQAAELLPENPEIRISLGDIYRDMGIAYRAEEEYQQAVLLAPDSQKARQRLEKLKAVSP
jgi:Flp pilus assembly protein TadD